MAVDGPPAPATRHYNCEFVYGRPTAIYKVWKTGGVGGNLGFNFLLHRHYLKNVYSGD